MDNMALPEFVVEMAKKLNLNQHKGGWTGETNAFLLSELDNHLAQLKRLLRKRRPNTSAGWDNRLKEIADEAADVANFAMMLWDKYRPIPTHVRRERSNG